VRLASEGARDGIADAGKIDCANLSEIAYRRIPMALMSGPHARGERLRIGSIAEQFSVSVTPVRDAVFRLVSEGALTMRAATAISVPLPGAEERRETQLTRSLLEGALAERAATPIAPAAIDALEATHRAFVRAWGTTPRGVRTAPASPGPSAGGRLNSGPPGPD
jgi:GntR family colanic acid and biofilm gene transcriptional regulator